MKDQIESLKRELREFLELSKTITQEKWTSYRPKSSNGFYYIDHKEGQQVAVCYSEASEQNAAFIVRSRNISPAAVECLLVAVNGLYRLYDDTEGCADGAPDATDHDRLCNEVAHAVKFQLQQILGIWEASK